MLLHLLEHLDLNDEASDSLNDHTSEIGVEDGVDVADGARLDFVNQHVLVGESTSHNTNSSHGHVGTNEGSSQHNSIVEEEESEQGKDYSEADVDAPEEHSRASQVENSLIKHNSEDEATPSSEQSTTNLLNFH